MMGNKLLVRHNLGGWKGTEMTGKRTAAPAFGVELRRLRMAAGLSVSELARLIQFSKGYVSKVETGQKSPSPHFVRTVDAALGGSGRLITLGEDRATLNVDTLGQGEPHLYGGEEPPGATVPVMVGSVDEPEARYSLAAFRMILEQLRDLGQTLEPSAVVQMLKPHVLALRGLAAQSDGVMAEEALGLAAHFADFTGWMTQETGDDFGALRWIDVAASLAQTVGDRDMIANCYTRRAAIALYQQDAYGTISFAKQAQLIECGPRVMGLAVLREAQGHALAGDYDSFMACLGRATALKVTSVEEGDTEPPIGPARITDPVALAQGWSLFDLGRSVEAIEVLEPLLASTPKQRSRAWARVACRLALALASVREVDRACDLAEKILVLSPIVQSATIRSDLRQLSRMLNRWGSNPRVRAIMPRLSAALLPTSARLSPDVDGEIGG